VDEKGRHPGEAGFDPKKIVRFGVYHEMLSGMLYPPIWSNGGDVFSADGKDILIARRNPSRPCSAWPISGSSTW
jgi:multiple sugar transport system substrate-binding protein